MCKILVALAGFVEPVEKMFFFSNHPLALLSLDGRNRSYFCGKMRVRFAFEEGTEKLPTDNVYRLSLF